MMKVKKRAADWVIMMPSVGHDDLFLSHPRGTWTPYVYEAYGFHYKASAQLEASYRLKGTGRAVGQTLIIKRRRDF